MEHSAVCHNPNSLVITVKTVNPAAMHSDLLRGINCALRLYVDNPEKRPADIAGLTALLELQQTLMPLENQLEKAF
jgi:hypothetical protein